VNDVAASLEMLEAWEWAVNQELRV